MSKIWGAAPARQPDSAGGWMVYSRMAEIRSATFCGSAGPLKKGVVYNATSLRLGRFRRGGVVVGGARRREAGQWGWMIWAVGGSRRLSDS